jgi:tetratricopeptide (TPR) repeat protein
MTQEALMTRGFRLMLASALAMVALGWAAPAVAQNGTLLGRVVDQDRRATDRDGKPLGGKPKDIKDPNMGVDAAYVTLELKGDAPKKFQTLTDAFGDFYKAGLPPGTYDISIRKEWRDPVQGRAPGNKLVVFLAEMPGVVLKPGEKLKVPDIAAFTEEARAAGKGKAGTTAAVAASPETDAANKRAAEVNALAKDADAAVAAGKFDEAIVMLMSIVNKRAEKNETCAACYVKIGEAHLHLLQLDKAEAAFLKAIEQDPKLRDPYTQLASLYNGQRKFDEAAKMSAKANELGGAAGAGGGDAQSIFNAGIINWNAGKYPEARDEFAKAVKLDPKFANAQYYLGMAIFNLASSNKATMADAKAPFQEYLKLAPTGEFAEVAKAILATIK